MSINFYSLLSVVTLIFLTLTLSNCKECSEEQDVTYEKFDQVYYGCLGFEGHEIISFLKNNKDTVSFIGSGLQVYYEYIKRPSGNCEVNYKLLNHKVTFSNNTEGAIILHYFKDSQFDSEAFEIGFNSLKILKPTGLDKLGELPYDSTIVILGRKCKQVRGFSSNTTDSIYIDSYTDFPRHRIIRMKLTSNVYEVIP